ncbi:hypothetical protein F4804DRAFT_334588 [Jackrogersella minutella]|nr:hypothetical protein F4804DRAFT_334588 [Jackrogersella minutella]
MSRPPRKPSEDELIALLTSPPGFDFSECEIRHGAQLRGMVSVVVPTSTTLDCASKSDIVCGVRELFMDVYLAYYESEPEHVRAAIKFYVAGFRKGLISGATRGIALPIGSKDDHKNIFALLSIAEHLLARNKIKAMTVHFAADADEQKGAPPAKRPQLILEAEEATRDEGDEGDEYKSPATPDYEEYAEAKEEMNEALRNLEAQVTAGLAKLDELKEKSFRLEVRLLRHERDFRRQRNAARRARG